MEAPKIQFDYSYVDLLQRIIKVEEELKHQREMIQYSREDMNKRFNVVLTFIGGSTVLLSLLIAMFSFIQ